MPTASRLKPMADSKNIKPNTAAIKSGKVRTGPKEKEIDWKKLDEACSMNLNIYQAAEVCGVHYLTLLKRLEETHKMSFMQYKAAKLKDVQAMLFQRMKTLADDGNIDMLKYVDQKLAKYGDEAVEAEDKNNQKNLTITINFKEAKGIVAQDTYIDADYEEIGSDQGTEDPLLGPGD